MSYSDDLLTQLALDSSEPVVAQTRFGPVRGRRAHNGVAVWLEIPYALPPGRFQDPQSLPNDYRYEDKEYIKQNSYAAQPYVDGQAAAAAGALIEYKVGRGKPTEDCLFVNISSPGEFPSVSGLPVKVYIHGGFLQFGSPHSIGSQTHFITARRNEVWVNMSYRLSIFGFFACDEPRIEGNYGLKDLWKAMEWIKNNISAFGGNPNDIQLTGLSAGAHALHQLMHHGSHLPKGQTIPFTSVFLQSNAVISTPRSLPQMRPQFQAVCHGLGLDPSSPDILETLSDPTKVPPSVLTELIDSGKLGSFGTFRPSLDGVFLPVSPDPMAWQRSGELGRKLKENGIKSACLGEVSEEWYLYAVAHIIERFADIRPNLDRYYPAEIVGGLIEHHGEELKGENEQKRVFQLFGRMFSDGQVYLPIRILHRDLANAGIPVLRYDIRWIPEQSRINGYVAHSCDRVVWTYRQAGHSAEQLQVIGDWLDVFFKELRELEEGKAPRNLAQVLTLKEDKSIAWVEDPRWDELMNKLRLIVPGER